MGKSNVADNRRQRTNMSQKEEDINPFFTPNNIKKGVGIGLLLLSVFMVIGFYPIFLHGKNDQDKVLEFSWRLIF
ncbi:MAG: hypothetical protein IPJ22_10065 [Bacteroidetes bacterium]|nr:hypothetical protein [Bacteroidota bacterium]